MDKAYIWTLDIKCQGRKSSKRVQKVLAALGETCERQNARITNAIEGYKDGCWLTWVFIESAARFESEDAAKPCGEKVNALLLHELPLRRWLRFGNVGSVSVSLKEFASGLLRTFDTIYEDFLAKQPKNSRMRGNEG